MARLLTNKAKPKGKGKSASSEKLGDKARKQAKADKNAASETVALKPSNRREITRAIVAEMQKIDEEADGLALRRKAVTGRIRSELGMKKADFMAALRIYSLDRDDRAEYLETVGEVWNHLGIGREIKQLDWLEHTVAVDRKIIAQDAADLKKAVEAAKREGIKAGLDGKWPKDNPHPEGVPEHPAWEEGRLNGQEQLAKRMDPNNPSGAGDGQPVLN